MLTSVTTARARCASAFYFVRMYALTKKKTLTVTKCHQLLICTEKTAETRFTRKAGVS